MAQLETLEKTDSIPINYKMIEIENVNKIYPNGVQALFSLNLSIQKKDFVVFVGPSGCGKTTTLRLIAGLETISAGKLIIDKKLANNLLPQDRKISMVFQNYALYPHLSIYKNIKFPLENDKKALWNFYKNNYLLKKEIEKIFYKFNGESSDKLSQLALKNKIMIQNKFALKELNTKFVSDVLKLKSDFKTKKQNFKISKKLKSLVLANEKTTKLSANYKKSKNVLKKDFSFAKAKLVKLQSKNKVALKEIKRSFKKKKVAAFNKLEFAKAKNALIAKKQVKRPYRTWKKQNHNKIMWAASILGLSNFIYRKPRDLSGGQRQRVALGRAIVRNPKIFLLDEPLSNLDAKLRSQTRETILDIHNKLDAATIYVTHDQVEAMTMATKIVVLKAGFVQQIAAPSQVYNQPANMFVASFIGSPEINFFAGKLQNHNFVATEISFAIPKGILEKLANYQNQELILGIRPEDMSPRNEIINTYHDTKMSFQIISKELLGKEVIFYGKINGGSKTRRVILNTSDVFIKNNALTLGVNKNHLHFFDPQTKEAINHSKSQATTMALKIWRESKDKRLRNEKLLEIEKKKLRNKGIINKIINFVQKKLPSRKIDGKA